MSTGRWHAQLRLDYERAGDTTRLRFAHEGPLRVFKTFHPEGADVCHTVVVHPPGGLVEGDRLSIDVRVASGAHGLVTTPGATRFYRCEREQSAQAVQLTLASGARLEWLPLETIAYPQVQGENALTLDLADGAELLAWDILSLGLPASGQPFTTGRFLQRMAWPGVWLDQGWLDGTDRRLFDSPLGLNGRPCLGTLVLACGTPMPPARRDALLDAVRAELPWSESVQTAATSPDPRLLVVRALAPMTEPIQQAFERAWHRLRQQAWGLAGTPLRSWRM